MLMGSGVFKNWTRGGHIKWGWGLSRALRRRHCVGGGAPVNFGRQRRAAGPKKSAVLAAKFSHRSKIATN